MGLCARNVVLPNCYNSAYIYKCLPRQRSCCIAAFGSQYYYGNQDEGSLQRFQVHISNLWAWLEISDNEVVKEREMEIGYPTDVKHVAHIGWDGPSGNAAPSWMKEFKTPSDFSATSISNVGAPTWSDQDYEQPKASKKHKRKKIKSTASSPKSSSSSSSSLSRPYRAATKSKPSFAATVAEAETRSNLLKLVP